MNEGYQPNKSDINTEKIYLENKYLRNKIHELKNQINDWQYYLAYFTEEDIDTPKGVVDWVLNALKKNNMEDK